MSHLNEFLASDDANTIYMSGGPGVVGPVGAPGYQSWYTHASLTHAN